MKNQRKLTLIAVQNGVINNIDRLSISIDFGSGTHNSYAITKEIAQNQYSMTSATTSNSATIIVTNFSSLRSVFVVAMNTDNNADTEVTITLGVA